MQEELILRRLDSLTAAVAGYARLTGQRLTRAEVCERLGIHRNTLPSYIKERGFPGPTRDGKWLLADVLEWECGPEWQPSADEAPRPPSGGGYKLYRHFDSAGTLLYVGISLDALRRLCEHRQTASWYERIARVEVQQLPTMAAARRAERWAICDEKPLHNIAMNARKRAT